MNYLRHYSNLIERAQNRSILPGIYFEKHHIIPKCMGGTNNKENIVKLLPEEHYVAHQLLIKIYPQNDKLICAATRMTVDNLAGRGSRNKLYNWLKNKRSEIMSKLQSGEKNSQFGKCWVSNLEKEETRHIDKKEVEVYLLDGWCLGKITSLKKICSCKVCEKKFLGRKATCSEFCRRKLSANKTRKILIGREKELIDLYLLYRNLDRCLKEMGFPGNQAKYGERARKILKNAGIA